MFPGDIVSQAERHNLTSVNFARQYLTCSHIQFLQYGGKSSGKWQLVSLPHYSILYATRIHNIMKPLDATMFTENNV